MLWEFFSFSYLARPLPLTVVFLVPDSSNLKPTFPVFPISTQIEVDEKISKLKNLLDELLNKQKQQLEKLNEYEDKKNKKSPSYIFDNELKKSLSEWAQNESQIKGKNRKSTINKDTIDKLYSCLKSLENKDTIDSLFEKFQNMKALYASTTSP